MSVFVRVRPCPKAPFPTRWSMAQIPDTPLSAADPPEPAAAQGEYNPSQPIEPLHVPDLAPGTHQHPVELLAPAGSLEAFFAAMEFGAVQCVPQSPDCPGCPLADGCWARAAGKVSDLPVKGARPSVRKRYFHYIMPVDKALNTVLLQRKSPGIWRGLYEFPLLESEADPKAGDLARQLNHSLGTSGMVPERLVCFNPDPLVHKLSHQHLYTTFWIAHLERLPEGALPLKRAEQLPVPVLIANFLETVKNSYF